MKTKMVPLRNLLALLGALFVLNSCGGGGSSSGCPVCGTQKNGPIGLIDVMLVPEHNPNGEPGGPFNIFDTSWVDTSTTSTAGETIPPITTAQGNYTRFGCKTNTFRLPGFFGPNGHFGGFLGGQCCASRSNNLNPLSGPNGLEVSADGNFLFVGNGSSELLVFDLAPMITSNYSSAPTL